MSTLNSTKYRNNSRTITGLNNAVLQDDVLLLCDTSGGVVSIDLAELPPDFWSVTYRLYVIDLSGNAGTNNIIINAPAGYKINNQTTLVLNTNGEGCMVRILDNTNYITSLNTTSNAATGFISLTVVELQALITAATVVQGTYYLVTDANLSDLGIVVQGITSTTVSLEGKGLFLNADYLNVSGNNVGVWNLNMGAVTANVSICEWDGLMYLSSDGVVGATPVEAEHWTVITKSVANGYILECDDVRYDPFISAGVDRLLYRADKRQNEVEYALYKGQNSLVQFQWGNYNENFPTGAIGSYSNKVLGGGHLDNLNQSARSKCHYNYVFGVDCAIEANLNQSEIVGNNVKNSSIVTATNNTGFILRNIIDVDSTVVLTNQAVSGNFNDNVIQNNGTVDIDLNQSFVTENFIHTGGRLAVSDNQSRIDRNEIGANFDVDLVSPNLLAYSEKRAVSQYSNFDVILDLSDGTIYDLPTTTLTIPLNYAYIGIFRLSNSNKTITKIVNLVATHDIRFETPTVGEVTTFTSAAVGGAGANDIVAAQAAGAIAITGRAAGTDDIVMRKNGTLNAVIGRPNVYQ